MELRAIAQGVMHFRFIYQIRDPAGRVLLAEDLGQHAEATLPIMARDRRDAFLFGASSEIWLELEEICLEFFPSPDVKLLAKVNAELERVDVDPMAYREDFRVPPAAPADTLCRGG